MTTTHLVLLVIVPIFVLAFIIYCWKDHRKSKKEKRQRKNDLAEAKLAALMPNRQLG